MAGDLPSGECPNGMRLDSGGYLSYATVQNIRANIIQVEFVRMEIVPVEIVQVGSVCKG